MEFSGQYLTYEEYRGLGGTLILMPFNILEFGARSQIDLRTQNRLANVDEIPEEVKLCVFHLIDKINSYAQMNVNATANGTVTSESIDGYSVSYVNATQVSEIIKSKDSELEDIMLSDLFGVIVNGVAIIYSGVI